MGLTVMRPVTVKVVVTEELKKQMAADLQEASRRLDNEMQRLEFQGKRMITEVTKRDVRQADRLRQELDAQRNKHTEARNQVLERLREVADLTAGTELPQGQVQVPAEINVGDDWDALLETEIVVKDGKVVEIRQ